MQLLSGELVGGVATIAYRRPLRSIDRQLDIPIDATQTYFVIGAIGNLNPRREANYHFGGWTDCKLPMWFSHRIFERLYGVLNAA